MFEILVSRNPDLEELVKKGYAVAFDSNYLVVRDIPYLDGAGALKTGALVTKLVFETDNEKARQQDHQVFFAGSHPCELDGKPIANLGGGTTPLALGEACQDVIVERSFSNKPIGSNGYSNFFEKIESYVALISGPAMAKYPDRANPYTFRAVKEIVSDDIFKFNDTMTSRAEITDISAKFRQDVIAVVGLGGSGAYLLDFLVKTPVREIRAFDLDRFHIHNAYRSPGRLQPEELGKSKAEMYAARYENFRHGLVVKPKFIDASSAHEFDGVTFAFVCVDKGTSRAGIFDALMAKKIPFIDVGMGLWRQNGSLNGLVRATYYAADKAPAVRDKNLAPLVDPEDDIYRNIIQLAELNALNAALAMVKFKQLRGFYTAELAYYHLVFGLGDLSLDGKDDLD
jgi:hypothetical protein